MLENIKIVSPSVFGGAHSVIYVEVDPLINIFGLYKFYGQW